MHFYVIDHRLKLVFVHYRFSFIVQVAEEVSIFAYLYVYVGSIDHHVEMRYPWVVIDLAQAHLGHSF